MINSFKSFSRHKTSADEMSETGTTDKEKSVAVDLGDPKEVSLEFLSPAAAALAVDGVESAAKTASNMNLPVNLSLSSPVLREWFAKRREEIRPWGTFAKTTHFETPSTVPKLSKRLYRNIEYFQSNYVFVFLILFLYCLITSPLLLIVMAASGGGCYLLSLKQRERKLMLAGREVTLAQQYALVAFCSIPLFLLAGAGSAVFWVIGASFFFIGLHASFYNFDALDLDNPDTQPLTGSIVEEV